MLDQESTKEACFTYFYYLSSYLMHALEVKDFTFEEAPGVDEIYVPDELVEAIKNRLIDLGHDEDYANKKVTEIFGVLTPLPSVVRTNFYSLHKKNEEYATDYLYGLSIFNNYVQRTKIEKNIIIQEPSPYNVIMTINLSKPEKSNADIAKALKNQTEDVLYPKCAICIENEGCYGSSKTEPRNNLRLIPMKLANEDWYLQYSPYGYFNEHCIVIYNKHVKMEVNKTNTTALFDFVDFLPHYFIGANSDLPIVGGSILSHEHFQGGAFQMPLMRAESQERLIHSKHKDLRFDILSWPSFVLRIKGRNKKKIIDVIDEFYQTYLSYSDESIELINKTTDRHNTFTTVVEKDDKEYVAYIIPRNNRCNEEHKGGIFHVREEYQHIKNEGIGLIEAMGLFVLPARLKRQLKAVKEIVENPSIKEEIYAKYDDLRAFESTIDDLSSHKPMLEKVFFTIFPSSNMTKIMLLEINS